MATAMATPMLAHRITAAAITHGRCFPTAATVAAIHGPTAMAIAIAPVPTPLSAATATIAAALAPRSVLILASHHWALVPLALLTGQVLVAAMAAAHSAGIIITAVDLTGIVRSAHGIHRGRCFFMR